MALTPNTRLGAYEIVAAIGAGGMGEVYRARDTRLGRDVAIKVLPDAFARDPERLARFEREAQLLASLSHPNIAVIHGLEVADGVRYLVLEYVPGETLAQRLDAGPLPVEDALAVGRQVAEALEAAHERGVIHRDLKPGNIKVTPEGKVKVLDFGLAKAFATDAAVSDLSRSPTLTVGATRNGVILGTAAYMSPEQARGKPVDKRTDIWSFGCVLYEALSGRKAFEGETVSDSIAAVLAREPDWKALPPATPAKVRDLLHHCLVKDAGRRLRDIGDARIEIEDALAPAPAAAAAPQPRVAAPERRAFVAKFIAAVGVLAAVAGGTAVWLALRPAAAPPRPPSRFALPVPASVTLQWAEYPAVAISRDGRRVVFDAGTEADSQLYMRQLDRLEATPIPGTRGAISPFFSPDGQWLGFFSEGKLKKVPLQGGPPVVLADVADNRGGSWGDDGYVYFASSPTTGLERVPAAGGAVEKLTIPDATKGERTHRWPDVLPGGRGVLITVGKLSSPDYFLDAQIAVVDTKTKRTRILIEGGTYARSVAPDHLVFAREGGLFVVPFDPGRLEVKGEPTPVLQGVAVETYTGAGHFAVSDSGSLVYLPGGTAGTEGVLALADRKGQSQLLTDRPGFYAEPRISPDGQQVTMTIGRSGTRNDDIWVLDLRRKALARLTFGPANWGAIWMPDGKRVVFASEREGKAGLYGKPADGSGAEELIVPTPGNALPESVSPDSKFLTFSVGVPGSGSDVWIVPLTGERQPQPLLNSPFEEWGSAFSPNGRWLAHVSNETGRPEIFVRPFPGPGGKYQISTGGGMFPVWSRSGRELFFLSGKRLMSVAVTSQPAFTASTPQKVAELPFILARRLQNFVYDVMPDGQRFVLSRGTGAESETRELRLVLDWAAELKRLNPRR
jgi:serine/threonine-protein kinase